MHHHTSNKQIKACVKAGESVRKEFVTVHLRVVHDAHLHRRPQGREGTYTHTDKAGCGTTLNADEGALNISFDAAIVMPRRPTPPLWSAS